MNNFEPIRILGEGSFGKVRRRAPPLAPLAPPAPPVRRCTAQS